MTPHQSPSVREGAIVWTRRHIELNTGNTVLQGRKVVAVYEEDKQGNEWMTYGNSQAEAEWM